MDIGWRKCGLICAGDVLMGNSRQLMMLSRLSGGRVQVLGGHEQSDYEVTTQIAVYVHREVRLHTALIGVRLTEPVRVLPALAEWSQVGL